MDILPEYGRILIENIRPAVDDGRYPVKREEGDAVEVKADVFRDGHDKIVVWLLYRKTGENDWHRIPMKCLNPGLDEWEGMFIAGEPGWYEFALEGFCDHFSNWAADTRKKADAGQDVHSELLEGIQLAKRYLEWFPAGNKSELKDYIKAAEVAKNQSDKIKVLLSPEISGFLSRFPDPSTRVQSDKNYPIRVERVKARYAAWYECFPRSCGKTHGKSGTFRDVENRLPEIKAMGFDVLYFPPIHPIGVTNRKGANNSLKCKKGDPGCPYSIGSSEGGHDSIEPQLGTFKDFERLTKKCHDLGMEIAIDFAINCSPDHPYLKEHSGWFSKRPDGSIKFAENPPKKYEDIYPIDFDSPERDAIWRELLRIFLFWADKEVRIFRVDNPHTKPFKFWEWIIREVQTKYPDVIFLAEAFTRPKVMKALGKLGFTQSYTYFTWRNFKDDIIEYFSELTKPPVSDYFRANLFVNTPDILPTFLQRGGRAAFKIRAVLAATLSSVYGIYSGFELCEAEAIPGKEEYHHSEKYEYKVWDWDRPGNIKDTITKLNRIRQENPALQEYENLTFLASENEHILFYCKTLEKNHILVAVNLNPFEKHHSFVNIPLKEFGIKPEETYQVHDLMCDKRYLWKGEKNYVELDPEVEPANIFLIRRWLTKEQDFDYYR